MKDRALVCGFRHPDGRWRLLAVSSDHTEDGQYALISRYSEGTSPSLSLHPSIGACDTVFMGIVKDWTLEDYEFCCELEVPIPPLVIDQYTESWMEGVLNTASIHMNIRGLVV